MIALISVAFAYNWDAGPASPINYHLVVSDFTAAEEADIVAAFEGWEAGTGEVMRGADMVINRDTDDASGGLCNLTNEVFMKDQAFFDAHGWSADAHMNGCLGSFDIIFNSSVTWCTSRDSACTSGESIGQAALHEMGHWIGFGEEDDNIATMNGVYPAGGDLGDTDWRVNEDDYVGLVAHRSDSSTGNNLMVARYNYDGGGNSHEVWDVSEGTWTFDRSSDSWSTDSPDDIFAVMEGTSSSLSPGMDWRLSSNTTCSTGDYLIGTRTPSLSSNTPYLVGPNAWSLADTVATGDYYLCVIIDPGTSISETSEADNSVVSEIQVEVIP